MIALKFSILFRKQMTGNDARVKKKKKKLINTAIFCATLQEMKIHTSSVEGWTFSNLSRFGWLEFLQPSGVEPSERLAWWGVMGPQLKASVKLLRTSRYYGTERLKGALTEALASRTAEDGNCNLALIFILGAPSKRSSFWPEYNISRRDYSSNLHTMK